MRKRCNRRVWAALPPRGLRPKLTREQVRDLAIVHLENLDCIARGEGDDTTLWQWIGGVLTWSRVAEKLQTGAEEMGRQLELVTRVVERFGNTGRVGFSGPDYLLAKEGCDVMDQLAEIVDVVVATEAATWSEARVERMSAQCALREAA